MTIPWLPFFVTALWRFGKRFVERLSSGGNGTSDSTENVSIFAFAWLAVPVVFFSFSGSKLPGYILPALPAAIILSADVVYDFVKKSNARENLVRITAGATLALIFVSIIVFVPGFAETDSVKPLFAVARSRGLDGLPVLTMHRVSHNAEFYATGPMLRDTEGKQERLTGPKEVVAEMRKLGTNRVLVMIPPEYIHHLTKSDLVETEVLESNKEWSLTLVTAK